MENIALASSRFSGTVSPSYDLGAGNLFGGLLNIGLILLPIPVADLLKEIDLLVTGLRLVLLRGFFLIDYFSFSRSPKISPYITINALESTPLMRWFRSFSNSIKNIFYEILWSTTISISSPIIILIFFILWMMIISRFIIVMWVSNILRFYLFHFGFLLFLEFCILIELFHLSNVWGIIINFDVVIIMGYLPIQKMMDFKEQSHTLLIFRFLNIFYLSLIFLKLTYKVFMVALNLLPQSLSIFFIL